MRTWSTSQMQKEGGGSPHTPPTSEPPEGEESGSVTSRGGVGVQMSATMPSVAATEDSSLRGGPGGGGRESPHKASTADSPSSSFCEWECTHPVTITIQNLIYAVPSRELLPGCTFKPRGGLRLRGGDDDEAYDFEGHFKILLNKVNMIARPGELLAIAGPSGSGKTTLLNVLAMRSPRDRIPAGDIRFNGRPVLSIKAIRQTSNYVMAHDKLLPYLTVYETLKYAADLKLPEWPRVRRLERVERIIADMCLDGAVRDTIIGGDWRKGLNAGELKRVAIGIELLDDPSVLILDEPTSGLDSAFSCKIVSLLKAEARKGKTVIITVHQPSSQIFQMFDSLLLLSHGRVAYHGRASEAIPYFTRAGFAFCKDWSPSDFMLDLISDKPTNIITVPYSPNTLTPDPYSTAGAVSEEYVPTSSPPATAAGPSTPLVSVVDQWRESEEGRELRKMISAAGEAQYSSSRPRKSSDDYPRRPNHYFHQIKTLWKRHTVNSMRNPLTLLIIVLVQVMQGLILGGIFFHLTKVGPGSEPPPLLPATFWNNSWVQSYIKGTPPASPRHPFVDMFEKGFDGHYSYGLANSSMPAGSWQDPIQYVLHNVSSCLHQKYGLAKSYPYLPDVGAPVTGDWTPRQIYIDAMTFYQVFDDQYPSEKHKGFSLAFFPKCKQLYPDAKSAAGVMLFFLCIMNQGRETIDPLVTCAGMKPLPPPRGLRRTLYHDDDYQLPPPLDEKPSANLGTGKKRRLGPLAPLATRISRYTTAGDAERGGFFYRRPGGGVAGYEDLFSKGGRDFRHSGAEAGAPRRRLLSVGGGASSLTAQIEDLLGPDLMVLLETTQEWVRRVTSCDNAICSRMNSIYEFVSQWTETTTDTILGVLNVSGCLFLVVAILGFASYDALLTFPQERALFNREATNGLYKPGSYYIAKNLSDLPFQLIPPLLMATILYLMVGFDLTAKQYFTYLAICILTICCAYGFGYMVSAGSPRMEVAVLVAPLTLVVWLLLAGFFLRDPDFPRWISWFKYFSFYRWGFFALVRNQFPDGGYFGTLPNSVHIAISGVGSCTLDGAILGLCVLAIAYRIFGFLFLAYTNRSVGLEA